MLFLLVELKINLRGPDVRDKNGRNCGKVFDILAESEKGLIQYKIARFLLALGLEKLGTFELVDLVKIIKNKQLLVDIKQEEAKDGYPAKAVVDVFTGSIYYPMSDAKLLMGKEPKASEPVNATPSATVEVVDDEDDLTIDASDAADVHPADDDDF